MDNRLNARPKIAFFQSDLEGAFSDTLSKIAIALSEIFDVNLYIFPGKPLKPVDSYDYQYNVIYNYATKNSVDAIILASGTLGKYASNTELKQFVSKFKSIPVISTAVKVNGVPSITMDNYYGLKQGINHLIKDHGKRNIAFIGGPKKSHEAESRYLAYIDALKENDIKFDPSLVYEGDFSSISAVEAIHTFIDINKKYFDALVASNDNMALTAITELNARNIKVPQDICVIGYDNTNESQNSSPALTTVRQPLFEMVKKAFQMALQMINGTVINNDIVMSSELIIRESCGCSSKIMNTAAGSTVPGITHEKNDPRYLADKFIEAHIENLHNTSIIIKGFYDFVFQFIDSVHKNACTSDNLDTLFKAFKNIFNFNKIPEDNITKIHDIVSDLTDNIRSIEGFVKNQKVWNDFINALHIFITDSVIKCKNSRWMLYHYDIQYLRQTLNRMISTLTSIEDLLKSTVPGLKHLGIKRMYIYLYNHEIVHNFDCIWKKPDKLNLAFAYEKERILDLNNIQRQIPSDRLLNNELIQIKEKHTILINPIFFMEEQLGLILCELDTTDKYLFESIVLEISCAIKLSLLINNYKKTTEKLMVTKKSLEERGKNLNTLSYTDSLTNLYNRRGFLNIARQSLDLAKNMGRSGHLFFLDIDRLKVINDAYGHDEGDKAIKAVADILRRTFRNSDVISRLGGDEFTILTIDTYSDLVPAIKNRFENNFNLYNLNSGNPYKLSVSMGVLPFNTEENITVEYLLKIADTRLYEQKVLKKNHRIAEHTDV
ncbi:MAG: GGDEF domain-containing protein [Bacillota bacterium]|nr:GGDEF domain-containing protein [Bacillota bacterium]